MGTIPQVKIPIYRVMEPNSPLLSLLQSLTVTHRWILRRHPQWHGRDLVWYEDNSVVLAALIKGSRGNPQLDAAVMVVHTAISCLGCRIWFEYIESESNCADEPSRLLARSPWPLENGFVMHEAPSPIWPWKQSVKGLTEAVRSRLRAAVE